MAKDLPGAKVVKRDGLDEAGAKMHKTKKQSTFDEFLETKKRSEEESLKPLSGDLEVQSNVTAEELAKLQEEERLYGYDPKTKTAMVLKIAFVEKKAKLKKEK